MIQIKQQPWAEMVAHAQQIYPNECVGVMLGSSQNGTKTVTAALRMENVHQGPQSARYVLDQKALLAADSEARARKLEMIGIYHSHPDCDAYFSETDLKNSCPWYSFVVLSIKGGTFDHANSWLPDPDQTSAAKEDLEYGDSNG